MDFPLTLFRYFFTLVSEQMVWDLQNRAVNISTSGPLSSGNVNV